MILVDHDGLQPIGHWLTIKREPAREKYGVIEVPDVYRLHEIIADIQRVGEKVKSNHLKPGAKIIYRSAETILPFRDRLIAMTLDWSILACLRGKHGREKVMPVNGYVLVEPEPMIEEIGGILLPDKSKKERVLGTVVRASDEADKIVAGDQIVYEPSLAFRLKEQGHDRHLINEALAKVRTQEGKMAQFEPIGNEILIEFETRGSELIVLPNQGLALPTAPDIALPQKTVKESPIGEIKALGEQVENKKIKVGDRVLVRLAESTMGLPGTTIEPTNPLIRLIEEGDVLGRYDQ